MRTLWWGLLFAAPALAQQVIVEGRYWAADAVHRARIEAPTLLTEIDFERDLGLEDRGFFDFNASVRPAPRHRLKFGFTRMGWDGDRQVIRSIEFAGRTYTFGTQVVSELNLSHARLSWTWQFLEAAEGRFRFGPLVEAHGMWFDASLAAPLLDLRASDERVVGYPTVGLALDASPHRRVAVFAEASGISAGDYGYTYGGEAGVRVQPVNHFGITAGYRLFRVDPRFDPDYARLKVTGPFVGAFFSF